MARMASIDNSGFPYCTNRLIVLLGTKLYCVVQLKIDRNMVIIYNYGMHILVQSQGHAPHLLAISMAMVMRQYGTKCIDLCAVLSSSI